MTDLELVADMVASMRENLVQPIRLSSDTDHAVGQGEIEIPQSVRSLIFDARQSMIDADNALSEAQNQCRGEKA